MKKLNKMKIGRKRIHDIKISRRLAASFIIISLITAIVGGMGVYGISRIKATEEDMYNRRLGSMVYINNTISSLSNIRMVSQHAVLNAKDKDTLAADKQQFDKYEQVFKTNSSALTKTVNSSEWKQKLQLAQDSYKNYFAPNIQKIFDSAQTDATTAKLNLDSTAQMGSSLSQLYTDYLDYHMKTAEDQGAQDARMAVEYNILLIAIAAIGVVVSVILGIQISRSINKPIQELERVADDFAYRGNLDTDITYRSENELGHLADSFRAVFSMLQNIIFEISDNLTRISQSDLSMNDIKDYEGDFAPIPTAMNTIIDSMNEIFTALRVSAEQVGSGSSQISNGAQELAQGAAEQASAIEELSASIAEVSEGVKENTEHVVSIAQYVDDAAHHVEDSNQQMQQMLNAMNEIDLSSNEIGKIIKVIDDIAFQTNILALNAAVEAARAGEAGKGFAVVADAAKQTTQLIESSIRKVKDGTIIADSTATALAAVAEQMTRIDAVVGRIKQASITQSNAVVQITQGIDQVSAVVQTNSATAEESAAASEELSAQAEMLTQKVESVQLRSTAKPSDFLEEYPQEETQTVPADNEDIYQF